MAKNVSKERTVATFKERTELLQLMKDKSTELDGDPNYRRWHKDWDFTKAAQHINSGFSHHHARYVAEQMGWKFEELPAGPAGTGQQVRNLQDSVNQAHNRIDRIEKNVGLTVARVDATLSEFQNLPEAMATINRTIERMDDLSERVHEMQRAESNSNRGDGKALRKTQALEHRLGQIENWARTQGFKH